MNNENTKNILRGIALGAALLGSTLFSYSQFNLQGVNLGAVATIQVVNGGTSQTSFVKYPIVGGGGTAALQASSTLWLVGVNATSTIADSTFLHASTTFGTTTFATSTNVFATTASTTNFFSKGLSSSCSGLSGFVQWSSGNFSCGTLATGWATSSQDYYNSQFRDWKLFSPTILQPTTTPMGILVNNSTSTITNLLMVNSTSTNATTTAFNVSSNHITIGSNTGFVNGTTTISMNIASTTLDAMGKSFSIGTTTLLVRNSPTSIRLLGFYCTASSTGTALVRFTHDNTNATETSTCTSGGYTQTSTNNTWTANENFNVQASSTAGSVNRVTVTPSWVITSD